MEINKCDVLLTDQAGEEDCSLAEDFSLDEEDFSLEADKVLEGLMDEQAVYREVDEVSYLVHVVNYVGQLYFPQFLSDL